MSGNGAGATVFSEMRELVAKLRSSDGCQWDREQTIATLAPHLTEEAEESVAEVQNGDWAALKEELGDVFLVMLMMIQVAEEEGLFGMDDVLRAGCEKLVRRHPHVFAGLKVDSVDDILANWRRIKEEEKRGGT